MIPTIVVTLIAIILVFKAVTLVPDGNASIVERLGRYDRTLNAGMHVVLPFVDRVAYRYSLLPTDQQVEDECITRDNIPVRVRAVVRAQIQDARQVAYATADAGTALLTLVRTHQRRWIGDRSWEDVRSSTREMEVDVVRAASEAASQFGVALHALDVKGIERT